MISPTAGAPLPLRNVGKLRGQRWPLCRSNLSASAPQLEGIGQLTYAGYRLDLASLFSQSCRFPGGAVGSAKKRIFVMPITFWGNDSVSFGGLVS
jgi:hypothetical protein